MGGLVVLLIVLAVIAGGVGLLVDALQFLLFIGLILLIVGVVLGFRGRSRV